MASSVAIGGVSYAIQPLTLGAIRSLTRDSHFLRIQQMMRCAAEAKEPTAEELDAYLGSVVAIISTALVGSGHPECDEAWVESHVDRETAAVVVAQVLAGSGFRRAEGNDPNPKSP